MNVFLFCLCLCLCCGVRIARARPETRQQEEQETARICFGAQNTAFFSYLLLYTHNVLACCYSVPTTLWLLFTFWPTDWNRPTVARYMLHITYVSIPLLLVLLQCYIWESLFINDLFKWRIGYARYARRLICNCPLTQRITTHISAQPSNDAPSGRLLLLLLLLQLFNFIAVLYFLLHSCNRKFHLLKRRAMRNIPDLFAWFSGTDRRSIVCDIPFWQIYIFGRMI